MMDFLDLVNKRYSCRNYRDAAVEPEKLLHVMECVRLAPSAVNHQPWRFYVVDSVEGRVALHRCYAREWFVTAPTYIVACLRHDEEWVRADGKRHGDIDVAIAVEHLCLAATEQGLGTCWVCNFDAALCREALGLAPEEEPVVIVPIGYPAGEPTVKNRKALVEILTQDK